MKLTRNAEWKKLIHNVYGITIGSKKLARTVIIFVVGNSSSKHSENVNNNFLIFGIMVSLTAIVMSVEYKSVNLKHLIMYFLTLLFRKYI